MDQQTLVAALEQAAMLAAQQQQMQGGDGGDMGRDMTSRWACESQPMTTVTHSHINQMFVQCCVRAACPRF